MSDILQKILADKRDHVARLKAQKSFETMDDEARHATPVRGFATALRNKVQNSDIALIAEIKKASPSGGMIRPDFSPAALARAYADGGAACLSVLTDEPYFQGSNQHLIEARAAGILPVLRKDFMIDVWQVAEARAIGADCILIIMAAVTDALAEDLYLAALDYGMDAIVEVHNRVELERTLKLRAQLIGINNRNLRTLKTDLATTEELSAQVPPDRTMISESGLATADDLARMQKCGVHCFLVGESLLRQQDVTAATLELRVS